jgi:hypothetical protein
MFSESTTGILLDVVNRLQQQSLKTHVECLYDPLGGQEDGKKNFERNVCVDGLFNPELTIEIVAWKVATNVFECGQCN